MRKYISFIVKPMHRKSKKWLPFINKRSYSLVRISHKNSCKNAP